MRAGWERWYVPAARVRHDWAQVTDRRFLSRHTLWHARSMARFVREHPETAAVSARSEGGAVRAQGGRLVGRRVRRRAAAYLAHRAELVATLGVALAPGDEVLDLACGDGGLGEHLLARGLRYRGVDAEPAMVEAARRRLGGAGRDRRGRPEHVRAARGRSRPRRCSARSTTPTTARRSSRRVAGFTEREARVRPQPAAVPGRAGRRRARGGRLRARRAAAVLRPADPARCRGRRSACCVRSSAAAARAPRAPRALHVPRRGRPRLARQCTSNETLRAERAPLAASPGRPRPARRSRSRPRRATGRRASGSATCRDAAAPGRRPSRSRSRGAIAGCLSAPRPSSPIRTRATPGSRTPSGRTSGARASRPPCRVPPSETSKRLYAARAGTVGSPVTPCVQPSAAMPVSVRAQADRAVQPDEGRVGGVVAGDLRADDLDAVRREDVVGLRDRARACRRRPAGRA